MKQMVRWIGMLGILLMVMVCAGCQLETTEYDLTVTVSGSGSVSPSGGTYDEGSTVTLIASPASGWEFTGWSGDVSGTGRTIQVTMDSNKTVVAAFSRTAQTQYSLTVNTSGNGSVSPTGGTYDAGTTVTLSATPASGWEFSGWSGSVSGANTRIQVTMDSNKSLTATFTETSQGGMDEQTFQAEDSSLTSAVVENEHNGFSGSGYVNFNNQTGSGLNFTVQAGASGNAQLTFRYANGSSSARPMNIVVNGNTLISGFSFGVTGGWASWAETTATVYLTNGSNTIQLVSSASDGGPNMDRVVVTADLGDLETYTLSVYTSGSGSVSPAGGNYTEGTSVTLTATPDSGWGFASWGGDASGTNPNITLTMTDDMSVTAYFEEMEAEAFTLQENETGFCLLDGVVESEHSGFTGTGYANTTNVMSADIAWQIELYQAGTVTLSWDYAFSGDTARNGTLSLDDSSRDTVVFNSTGAWDSWSRSSVSLYMGQGSHGITLTAATDQGLPNIDALTVSGAYGAAAICPAELLPDITVYIAGDSIVCNYPDTSSNRDQAGWGQMLHEYLNGHVTVVNRAIGARTALSFYMEGRLDSILNSIQPGDYFLIEFGHNDAHPTATFEIDGVVYPRYAAPEDFKRYLLNYYIIPTRNKGAIPVLVTPPPRNSAYCTGGNSLHDWAQAMRELAASHNVAISDLNTMALNHLKAICPSPTPEDFFFIKSDGTVDGTHFQENGARILAGFVMDGIEAAGLGLSAYQY